MSRIGVVTFPGTLDDTDAARAIRLAGSQPVYLWHASRELSRVDAVVLPGGFSYGDYLRAGAIAALAPVMAAVKDAADRGTPILGVCNGFQILCEAQLLPGALVRNQGQRFMCRDQRLRVDNVNTAWTGEFEPSQEITIPLKNGEGRFIAEPHVLDEIEAEGHVAFRYVGNPNGSLNDIAGLTDSTGRIVGLMPHPEHAVEQGFGPTTASGPRTGTDGLKLFHSVLDAVLRV